MPKTDKGLVLLVCLAIDGLVVALMTTPPTSHARFSSNYAIPILTPARSKTPTGVTWGSTATAPTWLPLCNALSHSFLDPNKNLEQLRLIEAGVSISSFPVDGESLSVDTADKPEQARAIAASINAPTQALGIGS